MTFEDEWARVSADAAQRQPTQMRLNQLPGGGGGGGSGDLVVNQDDLGAVGNEAYQLHARLQKKADIDGAGANEDGAGSSEEAARELAGHNFAMGGELSRAVSLWGSQVKTVLQMCAHVSNHLDYSRQRHAEDEERIAASMRHRDGSAMSVSEISKFVT